MVGESASDDFVVATGQSHSVEEFVVAAFAAAGIEDWSSHVEQDPAFLRPKDAAELVGDSSKLRTTLGWAPTVTFEDMVATMVRHDVEIESSTDSPTDER
jgi:GDPmannose 4,6-dehydratase